MNHEDFRALAALFELRFTQAELRRLLAAVPEGQEIVNGLPEVAPIASYAHDAADIIKRRGTYKTPQFWDVLEQTAGGDKAEKFRELRIRVGAPAGAPLAPPTTTPQAPPAPQQSGPTQLTVLLVSASPTGKDPLRVDYEFRDIENKVATTPARDHVRFVHINAARFEELRGGLLRHRPHVLHISSHGLSDGSLMLESRDPTRARIISKRQLLELLDGVNENLRLVIVNACESRAVACDIPPTVDLAVGMNAEVYDDVSLEFSVAFYEGLAYGKTVEKAFKIACASLDDGDHQTPELFPHADNDPDHKRKLVLIKPT